MNVWKRLTNWQRKRRLERALDPSSKWDLRMLRLAREVSTWSKDPSTQVGAVITDANHRIVSVGYNGFPRQVEDRMSWLKNRKIKYPVVIHAEKNAIAFAGRTDLSGCTMYTYPMPPCIQCTGYIMQFGMSRIVSLMLGDSGQAERWGKDVVFAREMATQQGHMLHRLYLPEALELSALDYVRLYYNDQIGPVIAEGRVPMTGPHSACDGTCRPVGQE